MLAQFRRRDARIAARGRLTRDFQDRRRELCTSFTIFPSNCGVPRSAVAVAVAGRVLEMSMSAVFGRRAKRCAVLALALFLAPFLALSGAVIGLRPANAETLRITVDQASMLKLPAQVATIVVGNPLVADASLQKGGVLILTGKGYGTTNLVALDRAGKVVLEKTLQVLGPTGHDFVVVYRGVERETYSCAPDCERRLTLGDSPVYFSNVLAQSGARNAAAK
jgi:hypothetical protein